MFLNSTSSALLLIFIWTSFSVAPIVSLLLNSGFAPITFSSVKSFILQENCDFFNSFLETKLLSNWWFYCSLISLHSFKWHQGSYKISLSLGHCLQISLPHFSGRIWGWLGSCQMPSCTSSPISCTNIIPHRSCGC